MSKYHILVVLALCVALTGCTTSNTSHQSNPSPGPPFDFSKYLSFTPFLPTYTDGYKFSDSFIVRSLNPKLGNVIQYWAEYGNPEGTCIQVEEARPKVFQLLDMTSHMNGAVAVTRNNVEYVIREQGSAASISQLKKVAQSIRVPAKAKPDKISVSDVGASSQKLIHFKIVKPGMFYVPQGIQLTGQSASVSIDHSSVTEAYSMAYGNLFQISEIHRPRNSGGPRNNGYNGPTTVIDGIKVTFDKSHFGNFIDGAAFTNFKTGVEFTLFDQQLSNSQFRKVLDSIVKASVSKQA